MTKHLPGPSGFFDAVLRVLVRHPAGAARKDIFEQVADSMLLSPEARAISLPSGAHLAYRHRIGWALQMLKHAGLVQSVARGVWRISDAGSALVIERPAGLHEADCREISRRSRDASSRDEADLPSAQHNPRDTDSEETPQERIDAAIDILRREVSRELLDLIGQSSPAFFEALVLDLLHALGYGTGRHDLQRVGGSGDGGIDGIISLDKLGLEKVYVQAKRWQGNVGRPDIQGFYGALTGRRARKGVFITTSSYTREAREFAESVSDSIVLVDGKRLSQLMIDHGVGVNHERAVTIPSVDSEYFEEA